MTMSTLIPVTLITGFLGSGKTTLLNRLLSEPALSGTVAIINEFGEIGLDHLLVEFTQERMVLLDNGCVCCTVRDDLVETLTQLPARHRAAGLPEITRVIIETTGLADPAPILHALMAVPELIATYRIDGVVTTVDAVNGVHTLAHHAEARKQAAVADLLLVTKADIAPPGILAELETDLAQLNAAAVRRLCDHGAARLADILGAGLYALRDDSAGLATWSEATIAGATDTCSEPDCTHAHHSHHHSDITSHTFIIDQPVEWAQLRQWLDYFASLRGVDLLRMKGIVAVADHPDQPLVLHGVQHIFHPPHKLAAWPSADRRTLLVFIVRNIPRETIERTLKKFVGATPARIRSAA